MSKAREQLVIGVDVGGTNMQFGVVDASNRVIGRVSSKTEAARGFDHVLGNIERGVDAACGAAQVARSEIDAIGLAVAGAIDIPSGVVLSAPNLRWTDAPLRDRLTERLRRPVLVENDVNGAVWGEYKLGAGREATDALGVWVGTGIGGGLVLRGRLYYGPFFTAGEIGHTVIQPDAEPGARTVEEISSRTGMRRCIAERLADHPNCIMHRLVESDPQRIGTDELRTAFEARDPLVHDVITIGARMLGIAIANWVTVLALDTVLIGGGITEALGRPYLDLVRAAFKADVFPDRCRACSLRMTQLAADAGLLGAALLARDAAADGDASNHRAFSSLPAGQ